MPGGGRTVRFPTKPVFCFFISTCGKVVLTYQTIYAMKISNIIIIVLTVGLLLGLAVGASAQTGMGEIRGTVTDSLTGAPLPDVFVTMQYKGGIKQEITDAEGNYAFKPLEPGTYDLTFSLLGSQTLQVTQITLGTAGLVNINQVMGSGKTIKPIIVYGDNIDMRIDPIHVTIDKNAIQKFAGERGISGIMVATIPGSYAPERSKQVGFRGSRTDATQYYVDGVKVIGELNIPQMGIEQVTVITGGLPAQYGDATGGVVLITTGSYR